jgi:hypothetical protein
MRAFYNLISITLLSTLLRAALKNLWSETLNPAERDSVTEKIFSEHSLVDVFGPLYSQRTYKKYLPNKKLFDLLNNI